ncbi:MAG: hypothetical protein U0736_00150 [Gemmataceae bacterium]
MSWTFRHTCPRCPPRLARGRAGGPLRPAGRALAARLRAPLTLIGQSTGW